MKKTSVLASFAAAAASLLTLAGIQFLPAAAAECSYASSYKDAAVCIGRVSVSLDELEASNYQVPVMVKIMPNPGVNALEFGVQCDQSYEVISSGKTARTYADLPTACADLADGLDVKMTYKSSSEEAGLTWMTYAASDVDDSLENFIMLLVTVPKTAKGGDVYPIEYRATGVGGASEEIFQVKENGTTTDYVADGNFEGYSGWISITGPTKTSTTTETTTTTTTTTTTETTTTTTTEAATTTQEMTTEKKPSLIQHQFETSTKTEVLAIEQVSITREQLSQSGYQVPVLVRMTENEGFNSLEFGVECDAPYKVIASADEAARYAGLATSNSLIDDFLPSSFGYINMAYHQSASHPGLTWAAESSVSTYKRDGNLLVLLVEVPTSASVNDVIPIRFSDSSRTLLQLDNKGSVTDYIADGNCALLDGYIKIVDEEAAAPAQDYGDLNNDAVLDIMDVIMLNKYLLGNTTLDDAARFCANVDGNDTIDSTDSLYILKRVVEMISLFPVEE